jgi:hypothetical protein
MVVICAAYAFVPSTRASMLTLFGGVHAYVQVPLPVHICQIAYAVLNVPVVVVFGILEWAVGLPLSKSPPQRAAMLAVLAVLGSAVWWTALSTLIAWRARRGVPEASDHQRT